jgi:trehalose 6-phosphate synthase/phosphatase
MNNGKQFDRLVIAAYRLPFKFKKTKKGYLTMQNSGGLVSAMLALSENFRKETTGGFNEKIVWTGVGDNLPDDFSMTKFENKYFDLNPVYLSQHLNELFYGGFCNDLIWPLFHYFPSYSVFDTKYFAAYMEANQSFCKEMVKLIKPGDFIWVHDYQLMMLPEMIREKVPEATIGFFLHIPFPSFEIFRLIPRKWREAIINGMLGADMIGFHTHDYTQHFIKSVKRTTGLECRQNFIYTSNKTVKADAFPIGIDYNKFHDACLSNRVMSEKQKIKKYLSSNKLIFSVDRLDYSKGLLLRLKGYETFLEKYPGWHSRAVFNMVVVPSRDNIEKYKDMKREIESTVGRINGKYSTLSWRPIIYQYKSLMFDEMVALYDLSDVGLITPLRDGMNLVAKEYIACQIENKGVLILSEMAGASSELNEALIINPADNLEMAEAIFKALEMKPEDKNIRLERMQKRISDYNVFTWAFDFFSQTIDIKKQQDLTRILYLNNQIKEKIISDYRMAENRIFFLDYDGTLVSFARFPEMATIDNKTLEIINTLAENPKNTVVIISGRTREFLERQFKDVNVTLIAEHGYFIRKPGMDWEATIITDLHWKDIVLPILEEYVNRCNGTFLEEKSGSLAWHYRNADTDYAQLRLHELRDDLSEIIRHKTDFEILEGNKVLEIKSGKYDKGQAVNILMRDKYFDFILAAGDDKTDEALFKTLQGKAYTIRIGNYPSIAKYNISDSTDFVNFLKSMVK